MKGAPDPYQTLGVARDASQADIKKAYRKLAVQYHPDRTGGDAAKEVKFKEISTAYEILGDPDKRARYDALGANGGAGFPGGVDLGDLFSQVFAGAGGKGGAGFDYQVFRGAGPGRGRGFDFDGFGVPPRRRPRGPSPRPAPRERSVRAADGTTLTQRGTDVHSDVRLQFDQAILGTVAEVATMAGKAKVKIPPGTPSGVKLRLKGKGASRQDGSRGDHYVTVHIDVPKTIDEESTRLLTTLMKRLRKDER